MAHFSIPLTTWENMDPFYRGQYRAWWRERGLRESLAHKANKEVSESLAKRKDQEKRGKPGFLQRMGFGGGTR